MTKIFHLVHLMLLMQRNLFMTCVTAHGIVLIALTSDPDLVLITAPHIIRLTIPLTVIPMVPLSATDPTVMPSLGGVADKGGVVVGVDAACVRKTGGSSSTKPCPQPPI